MSRRKFERGTRTHTKTDGAPDSAAAPAPQGSTPLGKIATIDTTKDVVVVSRPSFPTDYGYTFHDYERMYPNEDRVQILVRLVDYSLLGYHTLNDGVATAINALGLDRVSAFYDNLYDEILQKAVIRDGYRHLPDTLDNPAVIPGSLGLFVTAVINARTIKQLIDNGSWNDGTKSFRSAFIGKYRRATEAYETLKTFMVPSLYRLQSLMHPVIAKAPGETLLITFANMYPYASQFGEVDESHPAFIDYKHGDVTSITSGFVNAMLSQIEAAIAILRFQEFVPAIDGDSSGGFTWDDGTGRGTRDDLKYWTTLVQELASYPMGLPEPGDVVVDPITYADILYGECLYGMAKDVAVGVVTDCYYRGYPAIALNQSGLIYRRGFSARNQIVEAGLKEIWAIQEGDEDIDDGILYGAFATIGPFSEFPDSEDKGYSSNAFLKWSRVSGWAVVDAVINISDADDLIIWMKDGPAGDHQWNESYVIAKTLHPQAPSGVCSYSYHMPMQVPAELHRAALCATWNVPFVR